MMELRVRREAGGLVNFWFCEMDGCRVNSSAVPMYRRAHARVFRAGEGGAGVIAPSTLEASTVDLSQEFTGLITTQRAYSASSKIITTADQMLEELLNIKR